MRDFGGCLASRQGQPTLYHYLNRFVCGQGLQSTFLHLKSQGFEGTDIPSLIPGSNLNSTMHRKRNKAMTNMKSKCLKSIPQTHKLTFVEVSCSIGRNSYHICRNYSLKENNHIKNVSVSKMHSSTCSDYYVSHSKN